MRVRVSKKLRAKKLRQFDNFSQYTPNGYSRYDIFLRKRFDRGQSRDAKNRVLKKLYLRCINFQLTRLLLYPEQTNYDRPVCFSLCAFRFSRFPALLIRCRSKLVEESLRNLSYKKKRKSILVWGKKNFLELTRLIMCLYALRGKYLRTRDDSRRLNSAE